MAIEYTLSQLESVAVSAAGEIGQGARTWRWCTRLLIGGMMVAFLIGWMQDICRVAAIRAEPASARVVVITKEQAWLRIHPRLRTAGVSP